MSPRFLAAIAAFAFAIACSSACGYRSVHAPGTDYAPGTEDPAGPFAIIGSPSRVAYAAAAVAAAEAGARSELARAGQLASCSPDADARCAAIVVEILRVEELPEGIAVAGAAPVEGAIPLARGVRVTVTGRARVRAAGARASFLRDTGDVRSSEVIARGEEDGRASARSQIDRDEALRIAATTLGERLARRLLGIPDPGEAP